MRRTSTTATDGLLDAAEGPWIRLWGWLGISLGLALGVGCTRLNASHCGNLGGDRTCEQRGEGNPYCDKCEAANDGCVAQPVVEAGCGFAASTSSGESTAGESMGGESTAGESTAGSTEADSSGGGPSCGDGTIDPEEACDGEVLPPDASCATEGYGEGEPQCAADCSGLIYSVCPDYIECGNGEVAVGREECDGGLGITSCDDFDHLTGPGLVCTDECTFDTSACTICRESNESCGRSDQCCNANEECVIGLLGSGKCCETGPLGGCT